MASYNKVFLMGNLTRNPEIRYTNNQTAICSFGIAVNQGTREKPDTYFGECVCFGKTAEIIPRFTGKGFSVLKPRIQISPNIESSREREGL